MQNVCNIELRLDTAKALSRKGELLSIDVKLATGEIKPVYIRKQDLDTFRMIADNKAEREDIVYKTDKSGAKQFAEQVWKELGNDIAEADIARAKHNWDNMSGGSAPAKVDTEVVAKAVKAITKPARPKINVQFKL